MKSLLKYEQKGKNEIDQITRNRNQFPSQTYVIEFIFRYVEKGEEAKKKVKGNDISLSSFLE